MTGARPPPPVEPLGSHRPRYASFHAALLLLLAATGCGPTAQAAYQRGYAQGQADAIDALPACKPPPLPGLHKTFPGDPLTRDL